jgi:hypothetical protein
MHAALHIGPALQQVGPLAHLQLAMVHSSPATEWQKVQDASEGSIAISGVNCLVQAQVGLQKAQHLLCCALGHQFIEQASGIQAWHVDLTMPRLIQLLGRFCIRAAVFSHMPQQAAVASAAEEQRTTNRLGEARKCALAHGALAIVLHQSGLHSH